ncbi:hypothetical protein ACQP2U_07870 [Nocardia sp. CA-084685]|uniref:hypothetical protein n=1 Tax=Nocardia sp. CA-084685 TaxID=3239970 RepID=UPI003D95D1E6
MPAGPVRTIRPRWCGCTTITVTRRDGAHADGRPTDVERELFFLFTEFDENVSPYLVENIARYGGGRHLDPADAALQGSNTKSAINGYLFGNDPIGTAADRPAITIGRGRCAGICWA